MAYHAGEQKLMGDLRSWAAATYTGEGPVEDARREAVIAGAMLNNSLWQMCQTKTLTKAIVQAALEDAAALWDGLTKLRDTL